MSRQLGERLDITRLLADERRPAREVLEEVLPLVYDDLRRMAQRLMDGERPSHTLETTALVHEVSVRLTEARADRWHSREHLLATAARLMRHLLVDHARAYGLAKRVGGEVVTSRGETAAVEDRRLPSDEAVADLLSLGSALDRLMALDERQGRAVELRYFAGLSIEETAQALEISPASVTLDTRLARAWLVREIRGR